MLTWIFLSRKWEANPCDFERTLLFIQCHITLKEPYRPCMSRISYRVPKLIFSRGRGEGRLFEGGRLLQILSLRRVANSKRGAYLKLGANLSIYGRWYIVPEKSTHYLSNRKVFRVCIAWYKHERGWENLRQLCKPETKSRVCITVENSPNPSSVYIRLCKHRKKSFLLLL